MKPTYMGVCNKLNCIKCGAENDFQHIIDPYDFIPFKFFECWYCKCRQKVNGETGEWIIL